VCSSDLNSQFDEATKQELSSFIEKEQAQARVQESIHKMTSMCWDKCVTGTPSTRFSGAEQNCLSYCVDRFLDTSLKMVNLIQEQRNSH